MNQRAVAFRHDSEVLLERYLHLVCRQDKTQFKIRGVTVSEEKIVSMKFCIPVIPSADLEKSLRLWVDGLGFSTSSEMRDGDRLIFCMLRKGDLCFMLNRRAGTPVKPQGYEGIRLYWAPTDIHQTWERLRGLGYAVSELDDREYGQTEFVFTDDDGFSHCFGVPTPRQASPAQNGFCR